MSALTTTAARPAAVPLPAQGQDERWPSPADPGGPEQADRAPARGAAAEPVRRWRPAPG